MKHSSWLLALPALAAGFAMAADTPATVRATIEAPKDRRAAPSFALKDASGKTVDLSKYRGKVVLLDFWATWCHGCKEEIPWFAQFEREYRSKGFAVVGVSLDEDGWNVLRPFLAANKVPYRMLLGDDPTAKKYSIDALPDSFIIDREGRVAAKYVGLVDRNDVEANIKAVLRER
jgi:peroxiredoxin